MAELSIEDIYFAFEQRFRGSRDEIRARLSAYRPLLDLASKDTAGRRAIDYGCGRGEWLELARDAGFDAAGVDTNTQMVDACRILGLSVESADAVAHVAGLAQDSVALITAFHFVEHLPIDTALRFASSAYCALAPGGLLILETPNPENLAVGACSFYSDPTHERPLPPNLLRFCVEAVGFDVALVLRLNSSATLLGGDPTLAHVAGRLIGASPDYAVVAMKAPTDEARDALSRFVADTSQPEPLSLGPAALFDAATASMRADLDRLAVEGTTARDAMAATFDARLNAEAEARVGLGLQQAGALDIAERAIREQLSANDAAIALLGVGERELKGRLGLTNDEVAGLATRCTAHDVSLASSMTRLDGLDALHREADDRIAALERAQGMATRRAEELESHVRTLVLERDAARARTEALLASRSWRITAPLRGLSRLVRARHD